MLVIGLCIGFIVGNIVGVILMAIMASASRDSREREYNDLLNEYTQELTDAHERKEI